MMSGIVVVHGNDAVPVRLLFLDIFHEKGVIDRSIGPAVPGSICCRHFPGGARGGGGNHLAKLILFLCLLFFCPHMGTG